MLPAEPSAPTTIGFTSAHRRSSSKGSEIDSTSSTVLFSARRPFRVDLERLARAKKVRLPSGRQVAFRTQRERAIVQMERHRMRLGGIEPTLDDG